MIEDLHNRTYSCGRESLGPQSLQFDGGGTHQGAISGFVILLFFDTPSAAKPKSATLREKLLQMDPVSAIRFMGAVISYILALHYGGQTHVWNSSKVVSLLVGFVVPSATFAAWE